MILPPLSEFILSIPASPASSNPSRWWEDCLINGTEYLILTDPNNQPVRALTVHHLLNIVDASTTFPVLSTASGDDRATAPTAALPAQPDLELGFLPTTLSTETAARMVAAAPALCWVAVDAHQQYQGLVDKSRLLAAALVELAAAEDSDESMHNRAFDIKASQSNTALLTYLGHELKTPLTSLLGLSSLLRMGGVGELSSRQNRYIGLIQQHCRRLANWVNALIDLGRIESGTLRLIPQMVPLKDVWRDAYHQASLRLGQEEIPPPFLPAVLQEQAEPLTLVADPSRLQQMLSCLMQTALVAQSDSGSHAPPLKITLWDDWLAIAIEGLEEALSLEQLSHAAFTLPFPITPIPSTPISAEMGHWLEWLLVRKLAQHHRGELIFRVNEKVQICPTLLLPKTPSAVSPRDSRFLLVVAPLNLDSLPTLWRQADQLQYQLLITPHAKDALEIASYLPLSAVLVLIQSDGEALTKELQTLQATLAETKSLLVALVPPGRSAYLGKLPVDRELLWPTDRLGSVLLQPPPVVPSPNRLTILYLRSAKPTQDTDPKFPNIFHDFGCRVLEVDDLEQASLLKRVWRPHVAVLDPAIAAPDLYLQNLSSFAELNSLPLITLTLSATQAAHSFPELSVFPCLVEETSWSTPEATERMTTWLIQVLQVAATPTA